MVTPGSEPVEEKRNNRKNVGGRSKFLYCNQKKERPQKIRTKPKLCAENATSFRASLWRYPPVNIHDRLVNREAVGGQQSFPNHKAIALSQTFHLNRYLWQYGLHSRRFDKYGRND